MSSLTIVGQGGVQLTLDADGQALTLKTTTQQLTIGIPIPVGVGEANTAANVGGEAEVFRDKVGVGLNFRTLVGSDGIAATVVGDTVEIDAPSGITPLAHALGGAKHTSATLAKLNALVSDAVLDDSGDPRTPTTHATSHSEGGADEIDAADLGSTSAGGSGEVLTADGAGGTDWAAIVTTDELVGVTASDTTPGYLDGKIVPGAGLTRTVLTPAGDEDLRIDVVANADGSIVANAGDIQVGVLASDAQHGARGGGTQHAAATGSVAGFLSAADKTALDAHLIATSNPHATDVGNLGSGTLAELNTAIADATLLDDGRTLTAGAGMTGGGDLSANRTFDVAANVDGSIVVNANDIQVGVLASDGQHGSLGGGSLHAVAIQSGAAGFLSGADKQLIDDMGTTYAAVLHASTHAGAGGDPITTLGAVTMTGVIDWTTATKIDGSVDGALKLTDTAGTDFDLLQLGGTTSGYPAIKRSSADVYLTLADESAYARLRCDHIGIGGSMPTDTHGIFNDEYFSGVSGNVIGMGNFPAYIPNTLAANNMYGIQGNVFFGGANWAANSVVASLQFFPAPDYLHGASTWGSSNLDVFGIQTGGFTNILTKSLTCRYLTGVGVVSHSYIFGTQGVINATAARGILIGAPGVTAGTIALQTGLHVVKQVGATTNQGIWIEGDDAGADLVLGGGKDASVFYDGDDLVIDPDLAGTGIVLIGITGDDDMRLNDIEIDGDLDHDGSSIGFYGTTPTTKPTVTGAKGGNAALASLLTQLAGLGLITDSTT